MGTLVITGFAALGAIFMTMFFVKLCLDGSKKIKMCEVLKVDTEPATRTEELRSALYGNRGQVAGRIVAISKTSDELAVTRHRKLA